ncbi:hypothetical protein CCACVL1_07990 [Corchorus capsularis]|uniref:Uncharacterized protein n=1 Tax=Corchorus capsularis TaxID=210143 RepID=A0A1R3J2X8_COCAP|nr:hypothetical protein CCACVL1_07990 [Corchorus capsularis]
MEDFWQSDERGLGQRRKGRREEENRGREE